MRCEISNCEGQAIGKVRYWEMPAEMEEVHCLCQAHADHLWQTIKGLIAAGVGGFCCVPLEENIQ